jgi:hypothetical protein
MHYLVRCLFKKSFLSIHKSIHKVGSYCLPIRLCGNRVAFAFAEVGLDRSTQSPERHIQRLAVPYIDVVQEPARPLLLYATSGRRGGGEKGMVAMPWSLNSSRHRRRSTADVV